VVFVSDETTSLQGGHAESFPEAELSLQTSRSEPSSPDMMNAGPSIAVTRSAAEEELPALPIWSFTLGVFALLTFGLTAVPSIICGHLALAREHAGGRRSFAKSVALAGLVIGYIGAAVFGTWTAVMIRNLWQ
jgi:hypothetical protein